STSLRTRKLKTSQCSHARNIVTLDYHCHSQSSVRQENTTYKHSPLKMSSRLREKRLEETPTPFHCIHAVV
ncbi:hypothetical protein L9F63_002766, partial [Diploptera punctata]